MNLLIMQPKDYDLLIRVHLELTMIKARCGHLDVIIFSSMVSVSCCAKTIKLNELSRKGVGSHAIMFLSCNSTMLLRIFDTFSREFIQPFLLFAL